MKNKNSKLLPFLSLLIVFVINFIFIISAHLSWDNSMKKYLPLQSSIKMLKSNLSQAHLWFEEAIAGDPYIDIQKDVMIPFKHKSFSRYIQDNEIVLNGIQDQKYLLSLKEIEIKLTKFHLIAKQRWEDSKKYGIGSDLDQLFDSDFNLIIGLIDRLSLQIKQKIDKEIQDRRLHFSWIIAFFLLINIAVFSYLFIIRKR